MSHFFAILLVRSLVKKLSTSVSDVRVPVPSGCSETMVLATLYDTLHLFQKSENLQPRLSEIYLHVMWIFPPSSPRHVNLHNQQPKHCSLIAVL